MDYSDVTAAAERIAPHIRRTPILRSEVDGRPLVLKLEHLQLTGTFKIRGALNALLGGDRPDAVVTASGGNHGIAVATAARLLDLPATVYVPKSAPEAKVRRIEATGAKLVQIGDSYGEAAEAAHTDAENSQGALYLPAYDHPLVIAGQGTCAAEAVTDAPDIDTIVVAVGGGGLAAGTAIGGQRQVVAVEPENCAAMHAAFEAGKPVDTPVDSIAASALGATRAGDLTFKTLRAANAQSILVTDAQILSARDRLWDDFRLAVEPAAAVPLAAWLTGQIPGTLPCLIICGANSDWTP